MDVPGNGNNRQVEKIWQHSGLTENRMPPKTDEKTRRNLVRAAAESAALKEVLVPKNHVE